MNAVATLDTATRPDAVITFCTCSYNYSSNERTLVIASPEVTSQPTTTK